MTRFVRPLVAAAALVVFATPTFAQTVTLSENFNSPSTLLTTGNWVHVNNSDNNTTAAAQAGSWGPGGGTLDPPANGGNGTYFSTDATAAGDTTGTVSDWLLTPVITLHNGDVIKFSTTTRFAADGGEEGPSRLQVRVSTSGASTNVGTTSAFTDVGVFNLLV